MFLFLISVLELMLCSWYVELDIKLLISLSSENHWFLILKSFVLHIAQLYLNYFQQMKTHPVEHQQGRTFYLLGSLFLL